MARPAGQAGQGGMTAGPGLPMAVVAVALAAAALPTLGAAAAAPVCVALGVVMALPGMAGAALRRAHALQRLTDDGVLRRLLAGALWRVTWRSVVGTVLAAVLLVRLEAGGWAVWMATAAAVPAVLGARAMLRGPVARQVRAPHAGAVLRIAAQGVAALVVLVLSVLAGLAGLLPDPLAAPAAVSPLVAEAYALHRLWAGTEAALLGDAVALGLLPMWAAAALAGAAVAATGWAAAALTLAALMSPADRRRALAPATDAADPPAPGLAVLVALGALAVAVTMAAAEAEGRLAAQAAEARPVAGLQVAVERIGADLFPAGTHAARQQAVAAALAEDAAVRDALRDALDAGFDAMVANVDPFLDAHYSLTAEYARVGMALWDALDPVLGTGSDNLEQLLAAELEAALAAGAPFARLDALRDRLAATTLAPPADPERAAPVNPGRLRIVAEFADLPPLPSPATAGLSTRIETRLGVATLSGTLAGLIAARIARGLLVRGTLKMAASRLISVTGIGVAVGLATEAGLIALEEHLNRDAFRAEIVALIEAQRATALAALD